MKSHSPYHFAIFRIVLGIYLTVHFLSLIPYGSEVWSRVGIIKDATLNFTHGIFPNLLNAFDSPQLITLFLAVMAVLAVLFVLGIQRRIVALLLWYGWVCLFDRNNLIANPGLPFVGWLLLASAAIPKGEPLCLKQELREDWHMPTILFIGAWVIMSVSYSISGYDKLLAPSWRDGTAIWHLLENPLARDSWFREFLLGFPPEFFKIKTWAVLGLELLFLPLALFAQTRKWAWVAMTGMHFGILSIVDFADLTTGMLMMHIFTFDSTWLKAADPKVERIVFFDGVCGICNSTIDFLLKEDRGDVLKFATLQGALAAERLPHLNKDHLDSIIYLRAGQEPLEKSSAIIHILRDVGGLWKLALVGLIIPKGLRDSLYSYVAKNRYKWFGKKEACRMPTEKERGKLID